MKTVEIDDEVFGFLLRNVSTFGDTPNTVLRRLLKLEPSHTEAASHASLPIQEFLGTTKFQFAKDAVGRFIAILSWLYEQDTEAFAVVEGIRGRGRLYFSKSADTLERSGRNVSPKEIPGSPYWVITTTPTNLKQEMVAEVMKALRYDQRSIDLAVNAVHRG